MRLAAHRDLESLAVCELQELGDVLRIARRSTAIGFLCTTRPKSSAAVCKTASSKDNSPLRSFRSLRSDCAAAGWFHAGCSARRATACEPFAEIAARDIPLHCSPLWFDVALPLVGLHNYLEFRRSRSRNTPEDIMGSLIERTSSHSFQVFFLLIVELLKRFLSPFASSNYLANFACPGTPLKFFGLYIS